MKKKKSLKLSEIIGDINFEEIKELREKRKEQDKRTIEKPKEEVRKLLRKMEQNKKIEGNKSGV